MQAFTLFTKPMLSFGAGKIKTLPTELAQRGLKKTLLVVTPHFVNNGWAADMQEQLAAVGIESSVFSHLEQDAPDVLVMEGTELARELKVDSIVGIGGGKALDTAKAINIMINNPDKTLLYFADPMKIMTEGKPGVFLALCPTTHGTGSETTYASVVHFTDPAIDQKVSVGAPTSFAQLAIVDPEMTVSLPKLYTAMTGLDALCHCVGCITSVYNENPFSENVAYDAIGIILKNLPIVLENPEDIEARSMMSYASYAAGHAFIDQVCNLDHALSQSMGAAAGTEHGIACGAAMAPTIHYMCEAAPAKVAKIASAMGVDITGMSAKEAGDAVADFINAFVKSVGCPTMKELGYTEEQLQRTAELTEKDVLHYLCARPCTAADVLELLHEECK